MSVVARMRAQATDQAPEIARTPELVRLQAIGLALELGLDKALRTGRDNGRRRCRVWRQAAPRWRVVEIALRSVTARDSGGAGMIAPAPDKTT
jgi:hypothetical protein